MEQVVFGVFRTPHPAHQSLPVGTQGSSNLANLGIGHGAIDGGGG